MRATLLRTATELRDACETAEGRIAVAEHAIPTLIGLLRDPEAADHAAAAVELITVRNRRVRNQLVKLAVIDAGGIPPLVALLSVASATSGTVERAACTLCEMSSDGNVHEAICRAGGVPSLVALLSSSEASEVTQIGALRTLSRIAESSADAVYKAGAIAPAVALLSRAVDRRRSIRPSTSNRFNASAEWLRERIGCFGFRVDTCAVMLLHDLILILGGPACQEDIREAGAIPPLVALLARTYPDTHEGRIIGVDTRTRHALSVLYELTFSDPDAVLNAFVGAPLHPGYLHCSRDNFHLRLDPIATARLQRAEASEDASALRAAIIVATYLKLDNAAVKRATALLHELEAEAKRQVRRESLGLGHVKTPQEFICPITFAKMVEPVVASDGHSYERDAIERVMGKGNGLSPLTREPLTGLFPNLNLRKRIRDYDEEVLQMCETAATVASAMEQAKTEGAVDSSAAKWARRTPDA